MTYTPKPWELKEMGFTTNDEFPSIYTRDGSVFSKKLTYSFVTKYFYIGDGFIYPRSKEHLEQIIKAFTKPE